MQQLVWLWKRPAEGNSVGVDQEQQRLREHDDETRYFICERFSDYASMDLNYLHTANILNIYLPGWC